MKFIEYGSGFYYHNAAAAVQPNSNENAIDYTSHVAKLKERTRLEHFTGRSGALLSNSSNNFSPRISSETAPLPLMTPNGLYSSTVPT
jgi:hypothetical protein